MRVKCFMIEPAGDKRWRRVDDPSVIYESLSDAPVGAMYRATWLEDIKDEYIQPTDGQVLAVKIPTGYWMIDSRCNNCTRKHEPHHCWCRHGVPPNITVDKNGNTCTAGAGSILKGDYHGFLRNGHLEDA